MTAHLAEHVADKERRPDPVAEASAATNHAHRPVIEALALVARYAAAGNTTYYPLGETVPVHKAMGGDWAEVVHRTDKRGRRRVVRMVYEASPSRPCAISSSARRSGWSAPTSGAPG